MFHSEFVAHKIVNELIEALWYKLQMFEIPLDGPVNMFCDNEAVVRNTTIPESTHKKKSTNPLHAIGYMKQWLQE